MKAQTFIMLTGAAMAAALLFAGCVSNPATEAERNGATAQDAPITLDREEVKQETRENDAVTAASSDAAAAPSDWADTSRWVGIAQSVAGTRNVDVLILPGTGSCSDGASNGTWAQARSASSGFRTSLNSSSGANLSSFVNVYTPLYRHGCMGASDMFTGQSLTDFKDALNYYWENYNKGERPFFLIGFSQGANISWSATLQVINENPEMKKNHILTYALGTPGRPNSSAANAAFSQTPTDLNKVIDFAPFNETASTSDIGFRAGSGQKITNPLSWTTDDNYEPCTVNGVNRCNGNQILGTKVDYDKRALLVRLNPDVSPPSAFGSMGYHGQEYVWFASSIAQNMKDRIAAWNAAYGTSSIKEYERIVR